MGVLIAFLVRCTIKWEINLSHEWRSLYTNVNCFIVDRSELCYCTLVCIYIVNVHKFELNEVVRIVVLVYKRVNWKRIMTVMGLPSDKMFRLYKLV